jgi:hypothetical protein
MSGENRLRASIEESFNRHWTFFKSFFLIIWMLNKYSKLPIYIGNHFGNTLIEKENKWVNNDYVSKAQKKTKQKGSLDVNLRLIFRHEMMWISKILSLQCVNIYQE